MIRYFRQCLIIFGFTLAGELLHLLLPLPIPAAIYGLVLLFLALSFKIVKVSQIKEVSGFLTVFMSVLFVPPAVNLMEHWSMLAPDLIPIVLTVFISTVLVFTVSGLVTRLLSKKEER